MPPKPEPPRQGGGPNPPFGEDYFQRIVNVSWGAAPVVRGRGIAILLPTVEPGVTILSLPIVSRTVLKDGFIEFDSSSSGKSASKLKPWMETEELKPWTKRVVGLSRR